MSDTVQATTSNFDRVINHVTGPDFQSGDRIHTKWRQVFRQVTNQTKKGIVGFSVLFNDTTTHKQRKHYYMPWLHLVLWQMFLHDNRHKAFYYSLIVKVY